ncbi:hypothetical protein BGZ76_008204 [Entomortierella beljakovae]|nr:hypothetical protein BGZ76_008204 [Entomortierella beljakovae]
MSNPAGASPVTQVTDVTATSSQPEEKVSEDQFNALHASSVSYRDLLRFEERLKLNMNRLKKRQQKYEGMYSEKVINSSKFVPQCNRVLGTFNMSFNKDNRPELSFYRRVPKKFQEGFNNYRADYIRRKTVKNAAKSGAGELGRSSSAQNRRLQPSARVRRGAGGAGSASGSDSGARSSTRVASLTAGDGTRTRPLMRQGSPAASASVSQSL